MSFADIIGPQVVDLVVQAAIAVLGALLTALTAAGIKFLRSKTTAEQFEFLQHAAMVAVQATEQLGLNGYIADKKAVAEGIVIRELNSRGVRVTAEQLDAAIESAVLEAFNLDRVANEATVDADIVPPFPDTTGI